MEKLEMENLAQVSGGQNLPGETGEIRIYINFNDEVGDVINFIKNKYPQLSECIMMIDENFVQYNWSKYVYFRFDIRNKYVIPAKKF